MLPEESQLVDYRQLATEISLQVFQFKGTRQEKKKVSFPHFVPNRV